MNQEIDFIKLFKTLYAKKKFIIYFSMISLIFGVFYSLILENKFTSSTTFIPQLSSEVAPSSSSISGLASLAGISVGGIGTSSSDFPPTLYPKVVNGISFRLDLLSADISFKNEIISVREYLVLNSSYEFYSKLKKYTIGLPSTILSYFNKNNNYSEKESKLYIISDEDDKLFGLLSESLSLNINEKEGFISISYTDTNKFVAAQIARIAQGLLQQQIINFKNQSSKEVLDFSIKQYEDKKQSFQKLQDQTAIFIDKNQNISSSLYANKLDRLESEVNILESVVQQLASQVEQAKLQVNKNTPVFTTIEPVTIPFERSSPKRTVIVISYFVIGLIFSVVYILIRNPLVNSFNLIIKS